MVVTDGYSWLHDGSISSKEEEGSAVLRTSLLACTAFVGVACVTPIDWTNPQETASRVVSERDNFKKLTTYQGPSCSVDIVDHLFIRAWRYDSPKRVEYQVYVMDHYYDDWRFYSYAYDSNGKRMDFVPIDRQVASCSGGYGCSHDEHFGLNVTPEYLKAASQTGIHFKAEGKGGSQEFFIPPGYVRGFLHAVNGRAADSRESARNSTRK